MMDLQPTLRGDTLEIRPLRAEDFDVLYAIGDALFEEFKQSEYAPPPLLKRMVVSGAHGRKTGKGFYKYRKGSEETINHEAEKLRPSPPSGPTGTQDADCARAD